MGLQDELNKPKLSEAWLRKYKKCQDCIHVPIVFLTSEKIPVCGRHWNKLSESVVEW